jgi:tetratricopeptide (TPR) repeat protein
MDCGGNGKAARPLVETRNMKRSCLIAVLAGLLLAGCEPSVGELRTQAISEFQIGHTQQAKDLFQRVLNRTPDPQSLFYMGQIMESEGFFEQAIYYYQCAIDADPRNGEARLRLAKVMDRAGPVGQQLRFIPGQQPPAKAPPR